MRFVITIFLALAFLMGCAAEQKSGYKNYEKRGVENRHRCHLSAFRVQP